MSNMTIRKYMFIFLTLSVLFIGIGYILAHPALLGLEPWLCDWYSFNGELRCSEKYNLSLGTPLYMSLPYISASLILVMVVPQSYSSWLKFVVWLLPIMLIIVALTPVHGEDFGPLPPRAQMAEFLGQVFLAVSVLVIGIAWFWSGQTDQKTEDRNN